MAKKFNEILKEFQEGGGMEAAGSVLGDTLGAATSQSKYTGGQTGKAVGGGIGTVAGSFIGMPGLGQAVGSLIGGLVGGKSDKENMIDDQEDIARKKYSKLELSSNVNPYGSDNMFYMEEGGMPGLTGMLPGEGPDDPTKPKPRRLQPNEMQEWNQFLDFVDKKGYKGSKDLNAKNKNLGADLFGQFKKANPNVSINYDIVPHVQNEIQMLKQVNQGFMKRHNDPRADKIMSDISPVDGWFGSQTSQYKFPEVKLNEYHNGQLVNNQDLGLLSGSGQVTNPQGAGAAPKMNKLPAGVKLEDFFDSAGKKTGRGYTDPDSGDLVTVEHFGSGGMSQRLIRRMEEGGSGDPEQQEEQPIMVNIEKGELLIDPLSMDVVREYDNPNRYEPHNKSPMKEPIGNFTSIKPTEAVIPKKYAARYKKGDSLTRRSIIAEILKNQANNPEESAPRSGAPFAKKGFVAGPGSVDPPGLNFDYQAAGTDYVDPSIFGIPGAITGPMENAGGQYNWLPGEGPQIEDGTGITDAETIAKKPGVNKRLLASKALSFLPTAYGITNAIGADPYLRYDENTQMDKAKSYAEAMETTPNIEGSKAAIRRTNAGRNQTLNNFNSPSVRSEVAANNTAGLKVEGELIQNATNAAMDMRNRKRETLANLEVQQGQGRLNQRQSLMNELRADKGNRESLIHQGLTEGVQNFQKGVMDEERLKAVNTMAEYYQVDPYSVDLLGDQGVFLERVFESLGRLKGKVPGAGTPAKGKTTSVKSTTRDRVGNVKTTKDTQIIRH